MRWATWLALSGGLGGAGCGAKSLSAVTTTPVHPELQCPPGTWGAGEGPPQGTEVWCELRDTTGDPVRQGPSIGWHPNGKRAFEGSYQAGARQGPWRYWHPSGSPDRQGAYVSGLQEGPWSAWHPTGEPSWQGGYVSGKEHGPWTYWSPETLERTEGAWTLGDRTGRWLDYGPSGEPVRERTYRRGRLVNQQEL